MANPQKSAKDKTLTGIGNLIKLLPSGTVFLYQFLNPVLTNNGKCNPVNRYLSGALIGLCSLSCCFSSFTDSYIDSGGKTHYGIVTKNGLWPSGKNNDEDLSKYRLQIGDFVHAFLSLVLFLMLSLLDANTVVCFYPSFESTQKVLLMALPPALGAVGGSVFMAFPNDRHGIGYPTGPASSSS